MSLFIFSVSVSLSVFLFLDFFVCCLCGEINVHIVSIVSYQLCNVGFLIYRIVSVSNKISVFFR